MDEAQLLKWLDSQIECADDREDHEDLLALVTLRAMVIKS